MSQPTPDPTRWLTELMSTEHVMWPGLHIADTAKAMTAAAAPWTKAVADITALQLEALKTLAAPWTALMPGVTPAAEPIKDRRFASDAWTKDPRYEAVARTYLAQTDLMRKALAAAPIDEGSKAQWGFALQQVMDALSPANTLATNPEALQLAMETGGASLLEGMRLFTEDMAQGPDRDDRRDGVRGRQQRRHDAGRGGVRERADPADPVHADDREGRTSGRC